MAPAFNPQKSTTYNFSLRKLATSNFVTHETHSLQISTFPHITVKALYGKTIDLRGFLMTAIDKFDGIESPARVTALGRERVYFEAA